MLPNWDIHYMETTSTGTHITSGTYGGLVVQNDIISKDTISESVWNEPISQHLLPGTTGLSVGIAQYSGVVTVSADGVAGTVFPIGTRGTPVNNIPDALSIAATRGVNTFKFISDYTISSSTVLSNVTLLGEGQASTTITFESGCVTAYCTARDATVTGLSLGLTEIYDCVIAAYGGSGLIPSDKEVLIQDCLVEGVIQIPSNFTGVLKIVGCYSTGTNHLKTPTLDVGGAACSVIFKGYSGAVVIRNCTSPDAKFSIDFESGKLALDETVTAGLFSIRGTAIFDDRSTNTVINTEGLMNQDSVATAVWDENIAYHLTSGSTGKSIGTAQFGGYVHVDANEVASGTSFPFGTESRPVNNMTDALVIAASTGILAFKMHSDFTFIDGDYSEYTFKGLGRKFTVLTFNNTRLNKCVFSDCNITGILDDTSAISAQDCFITSLTNVSLTANDCMFFGVSSLTNNGDTNLYNCYDGVPGIGKPTINVNTCIALGIWNYQGAMHLAHIETPGTVVSFMVAQGRLFVDETDTEGNIIIKGMGDLFGTTGGTVLDTEGMITKSMISQAVWDEPLVNHVLLGTTGKSLANTAFESYVHIDTNNGIAGTTYPIGTQAYPVNNLADAFTIFYAPANEGILVGCELTGEVTCIYPVLNHHLKGLSLFQDIIHTDGGSYTNTIFENVQVTGAFTGTGVLFKNCYLKDIDGLSGEITGGRITGILKIAPGETFSGIEIVVEGDFTVIDLQNATDTIVSLDVDSGIITFINAVEGCLIELNLRGGEIVLDASCTGGEFYAEGYGTLYNESNMTILENHLLALETIPEYLLNKTAADFNDEGTVGEAINSGAVGGTIDEASVHGALDSYINKDDYKADVSSITVPTVVDTANAIWEHASASQLLLDVSFIKGIEGGKWNIVSNQMIFYAADNTTEIARFNLFNNTTPSMENVTKRERV